MANYTAPMVAAQSHDAGGSALRMARLFWKKQEK